MITYGTVTVRVYGESPGKEEMVSRPRPGHGKHLHHDVLTPKAPGEVTMIITTMAVLVTVQDMVPPDMVPPVADLLVMVPVTVLVDGVTARTVGETSTMVQLTGASPLRPRINPNSGVASHSQEGSLS